MHCFQHPHKSAVGHCTYCGRGLCQECTTVVEGKLSCRGMCQQEVARERRLLAGSETTLQQRSVVYETSSKVYQRSFAFSAAFAMLMLAVGVFLLLAKATIAGAITVSLGVVFLMHGIGMNRAGKKFKALAAQGHDDDSQQQSF